VVVRGAARHDPWLGARPAAYYAATRHAGTRWSPKTRPWRCFGDRPGHAQADFGEAIDVIGCVERNIHFFAFDLPHSDACFVVGYPAETTEAFCDGHVRGLRILRRRTEVDPV